MARIVTDSVSDLPASLAEELKVTVVAVSVLEAEQWGLGLPCT